MECVILSIELTQVSEEAQVKRKEAEEGKMAQIGSLFFFISPIQTGEGYTIPEL